MCSVCCLAWIFSCLQNVRSNGCSFLAVFIFDLSVCAGLWALVEHKVCLSLNPAGDSLCASDLEITEVKPLPRQLHIQECCHLLVDVGWCFFTLKDNIWFKVINFMDFSIVLCININETLHFRNRISLGG
jgi:hypothetical protein